MNKKNDQTPSAADNMLSTGLRFISKHKTYVIIFVITVLFIIGFWAVIILNGVSYKNKKTGKELIIYGTLKDEIKNGGK